MLLPSVHAPRLLCSFPLLDDVEDSDFRSHSVTSRRPTTKTKTTTAQRNTEPTYTRQGGVMQETFVPPGLESYGIFCIW
ncbi:hypothetical protein X797_009181 [Metarhizium robertsii]|uniref:Uncharacterized protein n=1 Tax=Metarhizium robertsii TaxID=568076 RepID=A0A0A1UQ74_9HYPO|nr:hypothetical protein X797_009181 [Metarhizium robertsii]